MVRQAHHGGMVKVPAGPSTRLALRLRSGQAGQAVDGGKRTVVRYEVREWLVMNDLDLLPREVRLGQEEREKLSTLFRMYLGKYPDAVVYLFGSRTYPTQRGGDLDLLIVSAGAARYAYELSKELRIAIKERLGDQRVDIVVSPGAQVSGQPAFVRLAFRGSVQIWP